MKLVTDFARQFGVDLRIDECLIVRRESRCFLLNESLKKLAAKDFFHAGIYLGKTKKDVFFPSFSLLTMIAEKKANKVFVDRRTEWLFICGRDIFKQGIKKMEGSKRKGGHTLVLNEYGECLGFGRIMHDLGEATDGVVVKNVSDIGDFLRREK